MTDSLRDDYAIALERENDTLRERVALLEQQLGLGLDAPLAFGLTLHESQLFSLLLKRDIMSRDAAMTVLYGGATGKVTDEKIIDVFMCKVRRKIKPFGVDVKTVWGRGWAMAPETKERVRGMMQTSEAAA